MAGVARYYQIAADLRERIRSRRLAPGERLPYEPDLMHEHDAGRATVRRALALLRSEGLVATRHGFGTYVRQQRDLTPVPASAGAVLARMPTVEEREHLGLTDGVPVLVWSRTGEDDQVLPADRFYVEIAP
ncbi:MAG: GntR family transcriptional regulator [Micromonosporaceae bacterium]|nr:GntR family transcriptional regulator [Micromonosporaceae bacterium]